MGVSGVSIHNQDGKGNTLLHYASAYDQFDVVASLLERGAQSTVPNLEGWTAKDVYTLLLIDQYAFSNEMHSYINEVQHCITEKRPVKMMQKGGERARAFPTTRYDLN
jgi:hypothetical protein